MQTPQHGEIADHAVQLTDEWVGGEITSNYNANDREAGRRQKGQLARTSGWNSACLQCHLICHYRVQSTLSNVWMQTKAPSWLYFPSFRNTEVPTRGTSAKCVDEYMAIVHDWLRATLWEAQAQSMAEAQWQKQYYNWKIGATDLKSGDLVLVKADTFQGKRKIKDRWKDEPHEVVCQMATDVPSYKVMNQCGQSHILHHNWLLLVTSETGIPLCVGVCQEWDRCTSPTPVKPTPKGSENKSMPWEDSGLAITQHQARKTSLGWINGKL